MLGVNLIGNLGADPELRYSADDVPFLTCNVAANYRTKGEAGGWADQTEWVRVRIVGTRAESLSQYLRKGSRLYVSGNLELRPWVDRDNRARAGLTVVASTLELLGPRVESSAVTTAHPIPEAMAVGSTTCQQLGSDHAEALPW
jgi:single-strand DNA-binding protein